MLRTRPDSGRRRGLPGGRLVIAAIVAIVSLFTYFTTRQDNPVTGEVQNIRMSVEQEIALGRQAAPQMISQHGGVSGNAELQAAVSRIGNQLVENSEASAAPYPFEFTVLADPEMVNAFALPGGQIFITEGLARLLETEGELAGVLAHEIVHVVGRHSAEQAARAELAQGLSGAAVIASYDPNNPESANSAAVAQLVSQMVNMKYGRDDELESDKLGVEYMAAAGYDPRALIAVMEVLNEANQGPRPPEFFSTHPDSGRRIEQIEEAIQEVFPEGVPEGLIR